MCDGWLDRSWYIADLAYGREIALDSACSIPLHSGEPAPHKFHIRRHRLEEMETAICADYRNGCVLELFKCYGTHRSRSGDKFRQVPNVCFWSAFAERVGA